MSGSVFPGELNYNSSFLPVLELLPRLALRDFWNHWARDTPRHIISLDFGRLEKSQDVVGVEVVIRGEGGLQGDDAFDGGLGLIE